MPNYEYRCTECAHLFELWQKVGEAAPACPECGSAVKKVFHAPRVIFKGSGFYVTDLRAEKESAKSGGSKSESSNGASSKDSPESSAAGGDKSSGGGASDNGSANQSAPAKTETSSGDKASVASSVKTGAGQSPSNNTNSK